MSLVVEILLPLFAVLLMIFLSFYFSRRKEARMEAERAATPFLQAVLQGNLVECKKLLAAGKGSADERNDGGETALMIAAGYGQSEIAAWLLSEGANVNARSREDATALMYAASAPSSGTVQLLLQHGADVSLADDEGTTALLEATYKEDVAIVGILLEAGANPNVADATGQTPLDSAAKSGTLEIVELLKKYGAQK